MTDTHLYRTVSSTRSPKLFPPNLLLCAPFYRAPPPSFIAVFRTFLGYKAPCFSVKIIKGPMESLQVQTSNPKKLAVHCQRRASFPRLLWDSFLGQALSLLKDFSRSQALFPVAGHDALLPGNTLSGGGSTGPLGCPSVFSITSSGSGRRLYNRVGRWPNEPRLELWLSFWNLGEFRYCFNV